MRRQMEGGFLPNGHLNQTIGIVECSSNSNNNNDGWIPTFLTEAADELEKIRRVCCETPAAQAAQMPGHTEGSAFVSHPRAGLDLGVKSLCLALNLYPPAYTVDSCSGLHYMAFINGRNHNAIATVASDDAKLLDVIEYIVTKGALGIQFTFGPTPDYIDAVGRIPAIVSLNTPANDPDFPTRYSTVRAYG